ncbi:MAG: FAD-dependent oxidoreductase [Elusimicrobiota bacterium]
MENKIKIIGGGLSGLSAGYYLDRKNINYTIFEKESAPGGLCRTESKGGFLFDYTGHLLHLDDSKTKRLALSLLNGNIKELKRNAWIFSSQVYVPYPFQAHLNRLPDRVKKECLLGYLEAYYKKAQNKKVINNNFGEWINFNFGKGIRKHFMAPYNKKLWTIDVDNLNTTWLKGYVPNPGLSTVLESAFSDKVASLGYNASFYYPKQGGIQSLINEIVKRIKGEIKSDAEVKTIDHNKRTIDVFQDRIKYDALISTMPLKYLILNNMKTAPAQITKAAGNLNHNIVLNINIGVNRNISDKHWIYFPEGKYIFYRAGFASNFSTEMAPKGCSAIYTEIALKKRPADSEIKRMVTRVICDLKKADILDEKDKILEILPLILDPAYVIYDSERDECVGEIQEFLKKRDIYSIGRYGKWDYSAMEDAILDGYNVSLKIK